jgi:hypothetical protein
MNADLDEETILAIQRELIKRGLWRLWAPDCDEDRWNICCEDD